MFVENLTTSGRKCYPFLVKIVAKGKSLYTSVKSIQKMNRKWKKTGVYRENGHPPIMAVNEALKTTNQLLRSRSSDSNTLKCKHHKHIIIQKKKEIAEAVGLDLSTIQCITTNTWAKVGIIVTAVRVDRNLLSTNKLLTKTASRCRSKHSVMCG